MDISKEDIEHLAELSRIELSEEEKIKLQKDASEIVSFFDQLKEAGIEKMEEEQGDNVSEAVADEKRIDRGTDRERGQFMEEESGYLKVPPVFE